MLHLDGQREGLMFVYSMSMLPLSHDSFLHHHTAQCNRDRVNIESEQWILTRSPAYAHYHTHVLTVIVKHL